MHLSSISVRHAPSDRHGHHVQSVLSCRNENRYGSTLLFEELPERFNLEGTFMDANERLTSIGQPVPELPVADVERAQQHYRDALAFDIGWLAPDKTIGAVSRGDAAIFFRQRQAPFEPAVHWIFAPDIDGTYGELKSSGANIVDPLERKPWGLRQFTVRDLDGNLFYFHCD
jgi:predicted enzyme related to lactoylglutathione lyase